MAHLYDGYISVYVRNAKEGPSCYYRIVQYIDFLQPYSFKVHEAVTVQEFRQNLNKSNGLVKKIFQGYLFIRILLRRWSSIRYDLRHHPNVVIIQREVFPRAIPKMVIMSFEKLIKNTKVIWDFDDDIFESGEISETEKKLLSAHSDRIVVTGEYLQSKLSADIRQKAILLPTTDGFIQKQNLSEMEAERTKSYETTIRIVWVGTSSNLNNLNLVIAELDGAAKVLKEQLGKRLILTIICNRAYQADCQYLELKNISWTREAAEEAILAAHIGIMPLQATEFAKGKGGFKLIQYISTGLPIIASDIGYNKNVVTKNNGFLINNGQPEQWKEALQILSADYHVWKQYSMDAYQSYKDKFSFDDNRKIWKQLLDELKDG